MLENEGFSLIVEYLIVDFSLPVEFRGNEWFARLADFMLLLELGYFPCLWVR